MDSVLNSAPGSTADGKRLVGSDRVLAVLTELATHPTGIVLDEIARAVDSPKSTVHRALASLRRAGFAQQDEHGHYVLGDEFLRIAFAHHEARPEHVRVQPILERLTERFGETSHFAVLDGATVVYRAKVDPPVGAMRLTSVVGGRNPAHLTAVGKLLLARELRTRDAVAAWVGNRALERRTPQSLATVSALHEEFELIRAQGFSVDDNENEPGINCLAVPVYLSSPKTPSGAISVSALAHRTPLTVLVDAVDEITALIHKGST